MYLQHLHEIVLPAGARKISNLKVMLGQVNWDLWNWKNNKWGALSYGKKRGLATQPNLAPGRWTIMEPGPMNAKQPSWGLLSGRMFNYGSKLKIIRTLILVNNWDFAAFLFILYTLGGGIMRGLFCSESKRQCYQADQTKRHGEKCLIGRDVTVRNVVGRNVAGWIVFWVEMLQSPLRTH